MVTAAPARGSCYGLESKKGCMSDDVERCRPRTKIPTDRTASALRGHSRHGCDEPRVRHLSVDRRRFCSAQTANPESNSARNRPERSAQGVHGSARS
jgi:hypothetical protein